MSLVSRISDFAAAVRDKFNSQAVLINARAQLAAAQSFTKAQAVTPVVLTDGATINTDASLSNLFQVTLAGNRTLTNPTNLVAGMTLIWSITQDATGTRTLAFGSAFKFPGGTAPALTTTASKKNVITGVCMDGATLLCTYARNF